MVYFPYIVVGAFCLSISISICICMYPIGSFTSGSDDKQTDHHLEANRTKWRTGTSTIKKWF